MTNLYSKLERGFACASFDLEIQDALLHSALKGEVGLVQSTRRRSHEACLWGKDAEGGDGDSLTKVITMRCSLSKSDLYSPDKEPTDIVIEESRKLFDRFCLLHGIPRLPGGFGDFGRQHGGGKGKRGTQPTAPGKDNDGGGEDSQRKSENPPPNRGSGRKSRKKLKSGGLGGDDGDDGGKRESSASPSSDSESVISTSSTETASDMNEPTTSSTGAKISTTKKPGKPHRKRRKIQKADPENSELTEPTNIHDGKQEDKVTKIHADHPTPTNEKKRTVSIKESTRKKKESKLEAEQVAAAETRASTSSMFSHIIRYDGESGRKKGSTLQFKDNRNSKSHDRVSALIGSLGDISRVMKNQKDSEWLQWTSSEEDEGEELLIEKADPVKLKEKPIQQDLQTFMNSIRLLSKFHSVMGLDPYVKIVRSNQCVELKWDPKSKRYVGVCLNALVYFMITLSIFYSLITILGYEEPISTTKRLVKLDFAHHFLEATFLMLLTLFMTVWAVSYILELGVHYSKFYNRFNIAICLTKYDVTNGIHEMILRHFVDVFLFDMGLVVLFFQGYFHTSIVRESCGFLGYTILRPFNFELRESIYYPLAEIFGLFVFCYLFLTINVVLLHFTVYAKALGNMATRFNIRMAYVFGSLEERRSDGTSKGVRKVIPFKKLFAEHQIITSLVRHISEVNAIVFGAFIFAMVWEIVLVMWLFFDIFLEEHYPYLEGVSIDHSGSVYLAVPLRLQKTEGERLMKAIVIFSTTWLMYWIFAGDMHNAGDALHNGIEFLRRRGLTLCGSSKERRFMLSMINSFSTKNPFWIGKKFQFSRAFFLGLTSFVVGASMVTVAFRPERLTLSTIEICNNDGTCRGITAYKTALHLVYNSLDIERPSVNPQPIGVLPPPGSPGGGEEGGEDRLDQLYAYKSFLDSPPCKSEGIYPMSESLFYETLSSEWPFSLQLPFFYKENFIVDPSTSPTMEYKLFESRPLTEPYDYSLKNCYGEDVAQETDDCNNHKFGMPKRGDWLGLTQQPKKQLIAVNQMPGYPSSDQRFFCCYHYPVSTENEVKVCNMLSKAALDSRCSLSVAFVDKFPKYVDRLTEKRIAGGRDDLDSSVPYNDPIRSQWTLCLCTKYLRACEQVAPDPPPIPTNRPDPGPGKPTALPPTDRPGPGKPSARPPDHRPPDCFKLPTTDRHKKYFTQCNVQHQTGKWKQIPHILYPTIFQHEAFGWVQKLEILRQCVPPSGQPLPSNINQKVTYGPVTDCEHKNFQQGTEYFEDECQNPILTSYSTNWKEKRPLRVVVWGNDRVVCCVHYQLNDPDQSRRQAQVCNNPVNFIDKCVQKPNNLREKLTTVYIAKHHELEKNQAKQAELEKSATVVKCLCQQVPYVHAGNYDISIDLKKCQNYILSFKL